MPWRPLLPLCIVLLAILPFLSHTHTFRLPSTSLLFIHSSFPRISSFPFIPFPSSILPFRSPSIPYPTPTHYSFPPPLRALHFGPILVLLPSPPSSSSFPINLYFSPLLQATTRSFLFISLFNSFHYLSVFLSFLHFLLLSHFFLQLPLFLSNCPIYSTTNSCSSSL